MADASLAVKWLIKEAGSDAALDLLAEWQETQTRIVAPVLLPFEAANVLYRRVSRGELSIDVAMRRLTDLLGLGIEFVYVAATHVRAQQMAHTLGLPATYDAHYLALAERVRGECWTADERLWNAVKDKLPWVKWLGSRRKMPATAP